MSASKMPTPQPAERVGAAPRNKVVDGPADEPDFRTLFHAWLESHRASLVDSLRRMWEGEHVTPDGYQPDQDSADDDAKAELARRFSSLTPQQMKILRLICKGKANKEISYELSIAEATVKTHITAIMSKINARRRTQAVLLANSIRLFEAG